MNESNHICIKQIKREHAKYKTVLTHVQIKVQRMKEEMSKDSYDLQAVNIQADLDLISHFIDNALKG